MIGKRGVSMVKNYKCPGCGASMVYDEGTNCMVCEYCGTKVPVEQAKEESEASKRQSSETQNVQKQQMEGVKAYHCPNCGAEIVTDAHTAATFCSFCGSPSMMEDRLSGYYEPKYVIPFQIDKEHAVELFRQWTKKGIFTPRSFSSQIQLDKITGMYVPYWLYDYQVRTKMSAEGKNIRTEIHGDTEYIYTDHYDIYRDVEIDYNQIPVNASSKMSKDKMERLEPFDYKGMKQFQMPYLSGFQAEKYNQTEKELEPEAEVRAKQFAYEETRATIHGYDEVGSVHSSSDAQKERAEYAMLPVWILNYQYKNKDCMITLNGQTGRLIGKLPISSVKVAAIFICLTAIIFLFILLLGGVIG